MKITKHQIESLAKQMGLTYAHLKAVIDIESSGSGFDPKTGKIMIQFEPHVFFGYTGKRVVNGVEVQSKEWQAYEQAVKIDAKKAMMATSWGMGQVMGFNHKLAGFEKVEDMVKAFNTSELEQVKGMMKFIQAQPRMFHALKNENWATFARLYNGPGYAKNQYDVKLKLAFEKAQKL